MSNDAPRSSAPYRIPGRSPRNGRTLPPGLRGSWGRKTGLSWCLLWALGAQKPRAGCPRRDAALKLKYWLGYNRGGHELYPRGPDPGDWRRAGSFLCGYNISIAHLSGHAKCGSGENGYISITNLNFTRDSSKGLSSRVRGNRRRTIWEMIHYLRRGRGQGDEVGLRNCRPRYRPRANWPTASTN